MLYVARGVRLAGAIALVVGVTALAICVVLFEIAAVLALRAHYTMDVFTGGLAAVWVAQVCGAISDRFAPFRIEPPG